MWQAHEIGPVAVVRPAVEPVNVLEPTQTWAQLDRLISDRPRGRWLVDVSQERILTSESLAVIVSLARRVQDAGGRITFAGCVPGVVNILISMHLVKLIPLFPDVDTGVTGLSA